MAHKIEWLDGEREPQCAPNPDFPDGIDIKLVGFAGPTCKIDVPYPAKRCGVYVIECDVCGIRIGVTTAGRPDDPRSVEIECRVAGNA